MNRERCPCPSHIGDGCFNPNCKCPEHYGKGCSGFRESNTKELSTIAMRGIAYSENGVELGSIVIRPEHIAFIAGSWCKQISRRAKQVEIINLAREHQGRMEILIKNTLL